jgi:amidase
MSSRDLVAAALEKIEQIDHSGYELRSVLATRSEALAEAEAYDQSGADLPLRGQPILIKDNIEAMGLPACAGSLSLMDATVVSDSPLVTRIKEAGGIVIGATNLSEWANIRSSRSTSGWSAVGGLTANPWIHQHSAGGSSSGTGAAVAADIVKMAVGSETDGSITCPASLNGCVGIKPTVGSVPREKMIPISSSQDSPGPMAQTVEQTVALLEVMTGNYGLLNEIKDATISSLSGIRIGVVKNWMTGDDATNALFDNAVRMIARSGATMIEVSLEDPSDEVGNDEFAVLKYELVSDLEKYLLTRPGTSVKSLADVVAFNNQHSESELKYFGQEIFEEALALGGKDARHEGRDGLAGRDGSSAFDASIARDGYEVVRARNLEWANKTLATGLEKVDVLIGCTYAPAWVSTLGQGDDYTSASWLSTAPSIAGAPIGTLPMGLVRGLPVGLGVVAGRNNELAVVRAMALIERAMELGVMQPTFIKD